MTVRELAAALAALPEDTQDLPVKGMWSEASYEITEVDVENGCVFVEGDRSW